MLCVTVLWQLLGEFAAQTLLPAALCTSIYLLALQYALKDSLEKPYLARTTRKTAKKGKDTVQACSKERTWGLAR